MKSSTAALSCGLPLRIAQAMSPPVRKAMPSCTVILGKTCFQKLATMSAETVSGISPAFTISIRSSSSSVSGASLMITAGFFSAAKRRFSATRLS